jgi:hypothetical protein
MVLWMAGSPLQAQDFQLTNPVISSTSQRDMVTFDFRTTKAYSFSKDDLSNQYASISFSLGSLQPSNEKPKGNGADLFNWVLTSQLSHGKIPVYTWVGTSRDVKMNPGTVYKISVSVLKPQGNEAQRRPVEEIVVTGQFSDPGNAPSGNEANNVAMANRREMNKARDNVKAERTIN